MSGHEMRERELIDVIIIPPRLRSALDEAVVNRLMESIASVGLRTPITIRRLDGESVLVAGNHRLEACRRLGMQFIDCLVWQCDDVQARMWEISENLDRAELTVLEKSRHIDEWRKLKAQLEPLAKPHNRGRPNQGINDAVRELGIERNEAQRAVKIAGLSEEAQTTAREVGLDNNQSALLAAARAPDPVTTLRDIAARGSVRPAPVQPAPNDTADRASDATLDNVAASMANAMAKLPVAAPTAAPAPIERIAHGFPPHSLPALIVANWEAVWASDAARDPDSLPSIEERTDEVTTAMAPAILECWNGVLRALPDDGPVCDEIYELLGGRDYLTRLTEQAENNKRRRKHFQPVPELPGCVTDRGDAA
jgi:ParB family chromosome partitioning protein